MANKSKWIKKIGNQWVVNYRICRVVDGQPECKSETLVLDPALATEMSQFLEGINGAEASGAELDAPHSLVQGAHRFKDISAVLKNTRTELIHGPGGQAPDEGTRTESTAHPNPVEDPGGDAKSS